MRALVSIILIAVSSPAFATEQAIVLVNLRGRRVEPEVTAILQEQWARRLPGGFRSLSAADLGDAAAVFACADAPCALRELGKTRVELAMRGEVSRLGTTYFVKLELLDVPGAAVERTLERSCPGEAQLEETLAAATRELLGAAAPAAPPTAPAPDARARASDLPAKSRAPGVDRIVRVENKSKQRALFAAMGGAAVATGGVLLVTTQGADGGAGKLAGWAITMGATAFAIGGIAYVLMPDYHLRKVTVSPTTDGKSQVGVAVAGNF